MGLPIRPSPMNPSVSLMARSIVSLDRDRTPGSRLRAPSTTFRGKVPIANYPDRGHCPVPGREAPGEFAAESGLWVAALQVSPLSAEECNGMLHSHIGPEQLLPGLLREQHSISATIVTISEKHGLDLAGSQRADPVVSRRTAPARRE